MTLLRGKVRGGQGVAVLLILKTFITFSSLIIQFFLRKVIGIQEPRRSPSKTNNMADTIKRKMEPENNLTIDKLDKKKKESDTSNLMIHKLDEEKKKLENNLMMDMDKLDKEKNKPDNSNMMLERLKAVGIWIYRLGIPAPIPVPTTREVFCAISLIISFLLVACGWKRWSQELESLSQELGLDDFQKRNRLSIVVFFGANSFVSGSALILIGFWKLGCKRMLMFGLILAAGLLIMALIEYYLNDLWGFFLSFASLRVMSYFNPVEERKKIEESVETKPDQPSASNSSIEAINQLGHLV